MQVSLLNENGRGFQRLMRRDTIVVGGVAILLRAFGSRRLSLGMTVPPSPTVVARAPKHCLFEHV